MLRKLIFAVFSLGVATASFGEEMKTAPAVLDYFCQANDGPRAAWNFLIRQGYPMKKFFNQDDWEQRVVSLNNAKDAEHMHLCGDDNPWVVMVPSSQVIVGEGFRIDSIPVAENPKLSRLVLVSDSSPVVATATTKFGELSIAHTSLGFDGGIEGASLESTPDDARHQAKAQIAKLKRENSELKTKLAQAEDELEIADVAVGNLGDALTALENEIKVRSLENEQLVAKLEGEKNSSTLAEKLLSSIEAQFRAMEARMERMEKKLTSLASSERFVPAKVSQLVDPSVSEASKRSLAGEMIVSVFKTLVQSALASHKTGDGEIIYSPNRSKSDKTVAVVLVIFIGVLLLCVWRCDRKRSRRHTQD